MQLTLPELLSWVDWTAARCLAEFNQLHPYMHIKLLLLHFVGHHRKVRKAYGGMDIKKLSTNETERLKAWMEGNKRPWQPDIFSLT